MSFIKACSLRWSPFDDVFELTSTYAEFIATNLIVSGRQKAIGYTIVKQSQLLGPFRRTKKIVGIHDNPDPF